MNFVNQTLYSISTILSQLIRVIFDRIRWIDIQNLRRFLNVNFEQTFKVTKMIFVNHPIAIYIHFTRLRGHKAMHTQIYCPLWSFWYFLFDAQNRFKNCCQLAGILLTQNSKIFFFCGLLCFLLNFCQFLTIFGKTVRLLIEIKTFKGLIQPHRFLLLFCLQFGIGFRRIDRKSIFSSLVSMRHFWLIVEKALALLCYIRQLSQQDRVLRCILLLSCCEFHHFVCAFEVELFRMLIIYYNKSYKQGPIDENQQRKAKGLLIIEDFLLFGRINKDIRVENESKGFFIVI